MAAHHPTHAHAHAAHPSSSRKRLWGTLALTAVVMVVEALGGWLCGSLALWADAGHVLFDLLGLVVALVAQSVARRPAAGRRTWGYRRLEVLAALGNSVTVLAIAATITYEAFGRWAEPLAVDPGPMMGVAAIGLAANCISLFLLHGAHHHGDLNVRGAFLHVLGDTLSGAAVIAGGGIIMATGAMRTDAVLSWGIAIILVVSACRLLRDVVDVLLESAPIGLDVAAVSRLLSESEGVHGVHALRIWSITYGAVALSAHVVVHDHVPAQAVQALRQTLQQKLQQQLHDAFGLQSVTLQMESREAPSCDADSLADVPHACGTHARVSDAG